MQKISQYDAPYQFEPLMPSDTVMPPLLEKASYLTQKATSLSAQTNQTAILALRPLLRKMNSYYTNRLEGQHTRPSEIESALQQNFSTNADLARKQRLALAHIVAEERCEKLALQNQPIPSSSQKNKGSLLTCDFTD